MSDKNNLIVALLSLLPVIFFCELHVSQVLGVHALRGLEPEVRHLLQAVPVRSVCVVAAARAIQSLLMCGNCKTYETVLRVYQHIHRLRLMIDCHYLLLISAELTLTMVLLWEYDQSSVLMRWGGGDTEWMIINQVR